LLFSFYYNQLQLPEQETTMLAFSFVLRNFAILALLLRLTSAQWIVGQDVKTTSGAYKGHADKTYPEVSTYLGIQFGQTTAGRNRFMPPKPFNGTQRQAIEAKAFGPACPQNVPAGLLMQVVGSFALPSKMSEDYLYLNVWTKPQTGEKKKGKSKT
jgi:cholinesterase